MKAKPVLAALFLLHFLLHPLVHALPVIPSPAAEIHPATPGEEPPAAAGAGSCLACRTSSVATDLPLPESSLEPPPLWEPLPPRTTHRHSSPLSSLLPARAPPLA